MGVGDDSVGWDSLEHGFGGAGAGNNHGDGLDDDDDLDADPTGERRRQYEAERKRRREEIKANPGMFSRKARFVGGMTGKKKRCVECTRPCVNQDENDVHSEESLLCAACIEKKKRNQQLQPQEQTMVARRIRERRLGRKIPEQPQIRERHS